MLVDIAVKAVPEKETIFTRETFIYTLQMKVNWRAINLYGSLVHLYILRILCLYAIKLSGYTKTKFRNSIGSLESSYRRQFFFSLFRFVDTCRNTILFGQMDNLLSINIQVVCLLR